MMSPTAIMVTRVDAAIAELGIKPDQLKDPDVQTSLKKYLLSDFEAGATLAINMKVAMLESAKNS